MTLLTTRTALFHVIQHKLTFGSPLLENCNRYHGPYISIRLELHALLFYIACTNCIVIFSSLLRVSSVVLSSIMPPRPSKCNNRPVSLDPKSLTLAELNALPRNSLILLASTRNLVTTGTKTRLPNVFTSTNVRMATKHRSLALAAQLHRRQTSLLKCSWMLTHRFVLQISSRANSLLQAHCSRTINLASFVRS